MKITVINNRAAGGAKVPCVDTTSVAPGATHVMTGRSLAEVPTQMAQADGNDVIILCELEGSDRAPIVCSMKHPADPAGGVTTVAAVGFDLLTQAGVDANAQPSMYLGVFDDAACTIPAVNGTLDTAAKGTIVSGAGTNLLKITPDATGEVSVTLTDAEVETVYIKAWAADTSYTVDSSDIDEIEFTAA